LVGRPDLADVAIGSVDLQCRQRGNLGHYRLAPPFRGEKPRLFERASSCRGPADYDPTPFVGPFPLLTARGDYLVGDFAAPASACSRSSSLLRGISTRLAPKPLCLDMPDGC
jgi:hypothetical protein